MIAIATLPTPEEAHVVKTKLDSEGIRSFVSNQFGANNPLCPQVTGGVCVEIAEEDLQAARDVLSLGGASPSPYLVGYECPACGSGRINHTRIACRRPPAFLMFLCLLGLGIPFMWRRPGLRCSECAHTWRDVAEKRADRLRM